MTARFARFSSAKGWKSLNRKTAGSICKKKSGRRPGHKAELRPTPTPEQIDRTLHVPCRVCPDCNVELVDPGKARLVQSASCRCQEQMGG
jgi:hypothetical protein